MSVSHELFWSREGQRKDAQPLWFMLENGMVLNFVFSFWCKHLVDDQEKNLLYLNCNAYRTGFCADLGFCLLVQFRYEASNPVRAKGLSGAHHYQTKQGINNCLLRLILKHFQALSLFCKLNSLPLQLSFLLVLFETWKHFTCVLFMSQFLLPKAWRTPLAKCLGSVFQGDNEPSPMVKLNLISVQVLLKALFIFRNKVQFLFLKVCFLHEYNEVFRAVER